ncbi:MAG: DUF742 protein, component of G-protein-coupled receptor (GPCR) system [uncultured Nocardioides sp.]|uniref:DUF742 protein, component of G-protein-coupled receptor (GPCR) system n=1 Tax=uncultured Nocardioides sp. TaxID=198441 RepID=A0A6J4MYL1_9ACTN|nr:MAG: DUF742 protein, component of G-protein-coupled receptor (GPCR) system [uncultured Nocardioides sp.]
MVVSSNETDGTEGEVSRPRFVRPYTITSGRTHSTVDLPLEATLRRENAEVTGVSAAALQVLEVCDKRSVAECGALVKMPIGVVRVLLSDLVEHGFIRVQATITENSSKDERIELIERTLRGLRTY